MTAGHLRTPLTPRGGVAHRALWVTLLVLAVAVQLVALYAPSEPGAGQVGQFDKLIHASIFAAPTFAALMAGLPRRWVLPVLLVHAPLSELVQWRLLSGRDGDPRDVVADVTGVLLAWGLHLVWRRWRGC